MLTSLLIYVQIEEIIGINLMYTMSISYMCFVHIILGKQNSHLLNLFLKGKSSSEIISISFIKSFYKMKSDLRWTCGCIRIPKSEIQCPEIKVILQ